MLDGELSLEALQREWPTGAETDTFFQQVFDDLLDGVEHAPGHWLRKGLHVERWKQSWSYSVISVDCVLLDAIVAGTSPAAADVTRERVLAKLETEGSTRPLQALVAESLAMDVEQD